jgi:hypothetical protein
LKFSQLLRYPRVSPRPTIRKWSLWSRATKTHILYTVRKSMKRRTQWDEELTKWFGRKLKEKFLIQKWNIAIRAVIDQIDNSNTFSIVSRDYLRILLNFKSFKLVRPRTHKSGPKPSCSNSISEYSID